MSEWKTNKVTKRRFKTSGPRGKATPEKGGVTVFENGWQWISKTPNSGEYQMPVDKLLSAVGLEHDRFPDKVEESAWENPPDIDWSDYRRELEEEGLSEDEINEKISDAEQKEVDEQVRQYQRDVESAVESYLTSHPVRGIRGVDIHWEQGQARVDVDDLEALVTSERMVMNGVGLFEASSNEELGASYPTNSLAETGARAFHLLADAAEVYGTSSVGRILDRR